VVRRHARGKGYRTADERLALWRRVGLGGDQAEKMKAFDVVWTGRKDALKQTPCLKGLACFEKGSGLKEDCFDTHEAERGPEIIRREDGRRVGVRPARRTSSAWLRRGATLIAAS